jgi:diguanylate cyclase (GGDEF)-like protein
VQKLCPPLAGDTVLKKFAKIITNSLRNQDIAFRFGGDEFYVLMPNTAIDGAFVVAERLRANIENIRIVPNFPVTASIGIAERFFNESLDSWFIRLDQALYKDKNKWRTSTKTHLRL